MAVDVKTLRIGSHVEYDGKRVIVYDISAKVYTPDYLVMIYQDYRFATVPMDEVSPIPLTPALLKELGFKCTDKGRIQSWWLDFFCLDHLCGKGYYNFGAIHLKYLHELESLYYLACGVELIKE